MAPESFSWDFAGVSPPGQLRHCWAFDGKVSTGKTWARESLTCSLTAAANLLSSSFGSAACLAAGVDPEVFVSGDQDSTVAERLAAVFLP